MTGDVLRFGVLGCADIARRRMLPAMAASARVRLTAVASRSPRRAAELAGRYGCASVRDYDALLERPDVDAVYVPLPTGRHTTWCARALHAGKHVLAEKPLTTEPEQTRALFELADRTSLILRENRMFVRHRQHHVVRAELARGTIGTLRALSASMTIPARRPDDIRYRRDLGGGALLDVGYYPLHTALLYLPRPVDVLGAHLFVPPEQEVDVRGAVLLRGSDDVTAQLTFGFDHSYRANYELCGTTGRITVPRAYTPPPDHQPHVLVNSTDGTRQRRIPADDQFRNSLERFVDAVRRDDSAQAEHRAGTIEGAELIAAVRKAAKHASTRSAAAE